MNASQEQQLISRWETYLEKIQKRFYDSLEQAKEACESQLVESGYDYNLVLRTWNGIKSQIFNITGSVSNTWDNKIKPQYPVLSDFPLHLSESTFNERLIRELDEFEIVLQGTLARMYYDHAIKKLERDFRCSQCGGVLHLTENLFRAHYVNCAYCRSINTYTPTTQYAQIGWDIIDNIVALELLPQYKKMQASLEVINSQRPPVAASYWDAYRAAYFEYYETYFVERAKRNVAWKERLDMDMERKQKEFEEYEKTYRKTY